MRHENKKFIHLFKDGQFDDIYHQMTDSCKSHCSMAMFHQEASSFHHGIRRYRLLNEMMLNGNRYVIWSDFRKEKLLSVQFNRLNQIESIQLTVSSSSKETNPSTKNKYHLPFKEQWFVVSEGANVGMYLHEPIRKKRDGYDFLKTKDLQPYSRRKIGIDGSYAFGEQVLSPLDGTVYQVVDGLTDEPNTDHPFGNHVIIQHSNDEYSLLAHLENDSIGVNVGDTVKTKQLIGRCGRSGNTPEPRLHMRVMNHPDVDSATALPIRWKGRLRPVRGKVVTSREEEGWSYGIAALDFSELLLYIVQAIPRLFFRFFG
ncbi:M23 family metallopeptidase [Exiguobacterium sp. s162]|uniref:M23 family metallopeptidase n=1 Tax=Exiguobacterium sp. s162 TaxID=2751276 RepID=UPI001BE545C7|nr:M23 family metallopeptidase [Exiguobacterium sp. s162]